MGANHRGPGVSVLAGQRYVLPVTSGIGMCPKRLIFNLNILNKYLLSETVNCSINRCVVPRGVEGIRHAQDHGAQRRP